MIIFLIIYIISYIVAFREVLTGNRAGILTFFIFGLSVYATATSVAFLVGLKAFIPFLQLFKEILVISTLALNIAALRYRPRLHIIDYLILAYLLYSILYAVLPIGELSLGDRLLALKSNSFYLLVYFTARLTDLRTIYINKYFNYLMLVTIAAGAVVVVEAAVGVPLQTITGYADYNYYFYNQEPSGMFGLNTTFESGSGYPRFAAFFTSPLEHAGATLLALAVMAGLYTNDNNKLSINGVGIAAFIASTLSIIFALSRAPLISYFLLIYVYALITRRKMIINAIHACFAAGAMYLLYLFFRFENTSSALLETLMNTIDFSDPSSLGHITQWLEGIIAIGQHPLGMGLGSSGRVAATVSENIGGENQFIIIGVQMGLIAILLYLCVYVLFIRISYKWLKHLKGKERKVCMAVLLIKVGLFIPLLTSEVESSTYISYMNWFLSGLLISMIMQHMAPIDEKVILVAA